MADIEIVIKIPEEMYKNIQSENFWLDSGLTLSNAYDSIKNGTPLPKGHGRLVDADELKKEYPHDTDWDYTVNTNSYVVRSIDDTPTIIEADKESEE